MNDITLHVVGNVVTDVRLRFTKNGEPVASFRMAAGTRRFDRSSDQWVDGDTHFFEVSCWRNLGHNVIQSISKGQPVVVVGRLRSREVHKECGDHVHSVTYRDLDAMTVGHDLTRGKATFTRVKHEAVVAAESLATAEAFAQARAAAGGIRVVDGVFTPVADVVDLDDLALDDDALDDGELDDGELVDPETGEILAREAV